MSHPSIRDREGFTLLEILVVVVIIGLLMAVIGTRLFSNVDKARAELAHVQIQKLASTLELYKLDNGRYPTTEQGLEALVREPTSDPRPRRYPPDGYASSEQILDPWGEPYRYEQPGSHNRHSFDIISLGSDQAEGGEGYAADQGNWDAMASN